MLNMWIVLMLVVPVLVVTVEAEYYGEYFPGGISWVNANRNCTLATPDLIYTADGITVDTADISNNLAVGDAAWLGYAMVFQVFQYIGCVQIGDLLQLPSPVYTVPSDPGQCFSACLGNKYFGIGNVREVSLENQSECYCMDDVSTTKNVNSTGRCDSECLYPMQTACGGGNDFISLYEHVSVRLPERQNPTDFCCTYIVVLREYDWNACSNYYRIMCERDSHVTVYNHYGRWISSTRWCFNKQQYPVTYNSISTLSENVTPAPLWTGMLRSRVIVTYNDSIFLAMSDSQSLQFGYLELGSNGTAYLRFTDDMSTVKQKSLCDADNESSITTLQTALSSTSIHPTIDTISPTLERTTSDKVESVTADPQTSDGKEPKLAAVYVGIPIAVVVLLAFSVFVFVLCRIRRKRKSERQSSRYITSSSTITSSNIETRNDVNAVYQNQPQNNKEHDDKRTENQPVYLNQRPNTMDPDIDVYIHPVQVVNDECKDAQSNINTHVQDDHTKECDDDDDDDDGYHYLAQGDYEDLNKTDSSTYSQLFTNEQPPNVVYENSPI